MTTRDAPCARDTASRHVVCSRARWLGTRAAREPHAARTARRRRSRGGAQGTAGDACALCSHHRLRCQRSGQRGDAMVRVVLTGTRDCEIAAANGHRADPAILRLHQTYRSSAERRTGTPLQTLQASTTEATDNIARSLSKNSALAFKRGHRATPRGMSSDRPSRGRPVATPPSQGRRNFSRTVLWTAIATLQRLATLAQS